MDDFTGSLNKNSSLGKVLEIFDETKFAFVPITVNNSSDKVGSTHNSTAEEQEEVVVTLISIRDILPIIAKTNIGRPIKDLSSPLISVDKNSSIRSAIDLMIKHGIRNIGIREGNNEDNSNKTKNHNDRNRKTKLLRILNDRKILEFKS
jgi:CBS domain-containing protein